MSAIWAESVSLGSWADGPDQYIRLTLSDGNTATITLREALGVLGVQV